MTEERTQLVVSVELHGGVLIGRDVEVQIVSADRGRAKLAIRAPKSVRISRITELNVVSVAKPAEPLNEMEETLALVRATASHL